ncbi:cupin domain-containing protein [Sphaerimonospora mesophila]|uniref:cupin domain-containing protein n=1 Tax=Sphaerimonospora mesophila TaxID=37483 RepID=UPI0009F9C046
MKINWSEHEALPDGGIPMVRRLVFGQNISCLHLTASEPGPLELQPHAHDNEQWVVVTAGSIHFVCEGEEYELKAGDVAYFPSGRRHTATRVGEDGAVLLELSAPARLDLVPGSLVPSAMRFD